MATIMYMRQICIFFWALIFNGEEDVSLITKRKSISEEHPLRGIVHAVRYVVKVAEHSYVFLK